MGDNISISVITYKLELYADAIINEEKGEYHDPTMMLIVEPITTTNTPEA